MAYKVIRKFEDTDGHVYEVGKPYPKSGEVTKKRLDELASKKNKYKTPFLEEVKSKE